jgi:hypothetical protein
MFCVEVLWGLTRTVQCVNHTLDDEGRVTTSAMACLVESAGIFAY